MEVGEVLDQMQPLYEASIKRVEELVSDWLQCRSGGVLEDWGCGFADPKGPWAKRLVTRMQYRGIDINAGPGVEVAADLVHRRSQDADAILIHHVLGISGYWTMIVDNAMHSFGMRMLIVEGANVDHPRLLQQIRTHARPYTVEILPDGRRAYLVEK